MSPLTEPTRIVLRNGWQPMDPDAAAYIAAVETADGQALEEKVKIAIDNFVLGCKSDGIWNAIKASCILAGARTLAGALVPLAGTPPTKFGTEGNWNYNRKTGLQGDGSTNYLSSNRNNNADPQNSKHLAAYGSLSVTSGTNQQFAGTSYNATGWTAFVLDNRVPSGFQPWINGLNYPSGMVPLSSQTGFFGASRSNSSSVTARIGSANYTSSVASQTPLNSNINIFRASSFSSASLAFYSIGEALDLALLDARVTDLINKFAEVIP